MNFEDIKDSKVLIRPNAINSYNGRTGVVVGFESIHGMQAIKVAILSNPNSKIEDCTQFAYITNISDLKFL